MKRIYSIGSILFLATQISYAQVVTKVSGSVKDNSAKGVINASVTVLQAADSSLVKADITDADGHYELIIPDIGKYLVRCTMLGYEVSYAGPFSIAKGDNYKVPDIVLANATAHLKDVTITSKARPSVNDGWTACRNPASQESSPIAPRPPSGATLCRGEAPPLPSYRGFGDRKGPS